MNSSQQPNPIQLSKALQRAAAILTFSLLFLSGCSQTGSTLTAPDQATAESTGSDTGEITVRKSPNDTREYRYLTLPNQLRVLLVSDPSTQKSAAALSVYRGSFHEPQNRPGLAHFLEHMLFIQTHTYPEIDGFQHHISGNGGSSNAYTALDHTNYFFDIAPAAFDEALSRFAHFFIDPVLAPEYANREKNAVHSEYQMQLKEDGWRGYMVGKQALNPAHPGSKFTIGSLETLEGDIQADLVAFFDAQYSADQMGLVVLSNASLDALEAQITPLFSKIQNKNIGPDYPNEDLYTQAQLPAQLSYQTQKDGTSVTFNFPIPSTLEFYKKKPELYFTNLLGHEGEGSLYQLLNQKGYVESLGASVGAFDRANSILSVRVELTPSGADAIPEITDYLFQYIDLLKKTPPQEWIYQEQATVAELGFRFQEKSNPMGFVYQMAPRLDEYPAQDLLVAPYLMEEFDGALIKEYLAYLTKDNLMLEIAGADVEGDKLEPWFRVPYSLKREPVEIKPSPTTALSLPKANPYLPKDLNLVAADTQSIQQEIDLPGIQLWRDTEVKYGAPRANLFLELIIDGGLHSAEERAMSQVYRLMVEDALSEVVYPAYLAGLGYGLSVTDAGFEVSIGGYQDKQLTLLRSVLSALTETPINPEKFELFKASLIRDWLNAAKDRPFSQAFSALSDTLRSNRWPRPMLVDAIAPITASDLEAWRNKRLAAISVQGLVHGNASTSSTKALKALLQDQLPIAALDIHRAQVRNVETSLRLPLSVDHNDAAMVLHLQDPDDSFASRAKSSLGAQLLHNAYFSELRTNQQLGYVVSVTNRAIVNRGGISFVVQSPVKGAAGLEEATKVFFDEFVDTWMETDDATFAQQKAGLINRLTEPPKNLGEHSQRYWADLSRGILSFDSRAQTAAIVNNLTKEDMFAYFQALQKQLDNGRLIIYSQGKFEDVPQDGELLESSVAKWG